VSDIKHRDVNATLTDISELLSDVSASLQTCKAASENLKPVVDAIKDIHSMQDAMAHMKKNILRWDAEMLSELEKAAQFCTFQSPNGHKCGQMIGKGTRQLIVGDSPEFAALGQMGGKKDFIKGFLQALSVNPEDVQECVVDESRVVGDAKKAITDLKNHNFEAFIADTGALLLHLKDSFGDCKTAIKDLDVYRHIMDDVHSKSDMYNKIKKNALDNDEKVMDLVGDMGSSCTFKKPSGLQCGSDLGTIVRLFLIGSVDLMV